MQPITAASILIALAAYHGRLSDAIEYEDLTDAPTEIRILADEIERFARLEDDGWIDADELSSFDYDTLDELWRAGLLREEPVYEEQTDASGCYGVGTYAVRVVLL